MSALDYRHASQPAGTLRLSSSDDFIPHQLTKYKPVGRKWGEGWLQAVTGYPSGRPPVATVNTVPSDFAYAHSHLKTPDGHAIPVVLDVPGHAPVLFHPISVSDKLLKPNDGGTVIQTNQNAAMDTKLPQETYIHLVKPVEIPMTSVVPHDGPPLTELQKKVHLDTIIPAIYEGIKSVVGYVIWNYEDLYNQFQKWDGSPLNLFQDMHFLWRGMVSAIITLGLIEIVPILESLVSLWWDFMGLVYHSFVFLGNAVSEAFHIIATLWDDADNLWFKLTGR